MKFSAICCFVLLIFVSCMEPSARKPIVNKTGSELKESININKKIIEFEDRNFKEIMRLDSVNNYITSSLGFWYKIEVKSNQNYFPKTGDEIVYVYDVFDIENSIIYTKEELGVKTYIVDKQEIVDGLRSGLKLMNEGDEVTFLFPSHKMFGYQGDNNKIGINKSLIYKVKLIKINKKKESI